MNKHTQKTVRSKLMIVRRFRNKIWIIISMAADQKKGVDCYLNPESALSKLDLPAPEGPMIADSWPFLNTPLTLCSKHFFFESVTVTE